MLTAVFILSRIIANPLSNVFQKKLGAYADARLIILGTHLLLSLVCLPALFFLPVLRLSIPFWENIVLCALLAVGGNMLIVAALQSADLSVLGPLNAYKSVGGVLLGALILGEYPNAIGILGILMILGGSFFILDRGGSGARENVFTGFLKSRGVRLRLAALVLSASEAVFLKEALLVSSPAITFVFWCILGVPFAAILAAYVPRHGAAGGPALMHREPASWGLLAFTTGLMQFSTLYTLGVLQVGYSLALFQTSTLLSVLFGYHFFQEGHLVRRLLGALVMIGGALLIVLFGSGGL
jgi:drug/metabolite transporter (DMT)-like permease